MDWVNIMVVVVKLNEICICFDFRDLNKVVWRVLFDDDDRRSCCWNVIR